MCAIFGIIGDFDEQKAKASLASMSHRGPEDEGFWRFDGGCLGHRRLAIIDPKPDGHQPFFSHDGSVSVVFNGEIYNFAELKKQLNYPFLTTSDTEVVVAAYLEWGEEFVSRLVGMFAIAIWDDRAKKLLLYRDRFGKKPLLYSLDGGRLLFASEFGAILPHLESKTVDRAALRCYLTYLAPIAPLTMYEQIKKLPAGHYGVYQEGRMRISRYYEMLHKKTVITDEREALEAIEAALLKSMHYRLVSDVEVGSFLSGGIDSSLAAALAQREFAKEGRRIRTFSIGYDEHEDYDERKYARIVADYIGSEHAEVQMNRELFFASIDAVVQHLGEPVNDPACVPTYVLSQAVHEAGLKVALCGEGSDEAFLGYEKYFQFYSLSQGAKSFPFHNWLRNFVVKHYEPNREWEWYRRILEGERLYRTVGESFTDRQKRDLLSFSIPDSDSLGFINSYESEFDASYLCNSEMAWESYIDFKVWVGEALLPKIDRMSMAHSLELRSPFMDARLIETALSVAEPLRVGDKTTKYLLKKIALKYIPQEIVYRRKKGFSYPFIEWLSSSDEQMDTVRRVNAQHGLFKPKAIEFITAEAKKGRFKQHFWGLYIFSRWYEKNF